MDKPIIVTNSWFTLLPGSYCRIGSLAARREVLDRLDARQVVDEPHGAAVYLPMVAP
jgi:hypothetical protein